MSTFELNGKDFATQTSSAEPVIASTVTGGAGLSGSTSLGTVTAGTYNATIGSSATFPAGHILQTIIDTDTGTTRTTSNDTAWENDIVGLSCQITSSFDNSNFLITAHTGMAMDGGDDARLQVDIKRVITGGATVKGIVSAAGSGNYGWIHARMDTWASQTGVYLDNLTEDADTTITYSLVFRSGGEVHWLHESSVATLMVQEIKA